MLKFFLGMLAGFVACFIIFAFIGAYNEVTKLRKKLNDYEKEMSKDQDTLYHCNVKENAELIAKILDDDTDGKAYEEINNKQSTKIGF